jgi:hypothetical protein
MAIVNLEISGGPSGDLQMTFTMAGSGRHVEGSVTLPATATPIYLQGADTDILMGPQAAAVSIKERVRSWKVKIQSGIMLHRSPGGGLYVTFHKIGTTQRALLSMVVAAKDVDDIRTLLLNTTLQEVQINTNSGAAAQLNMKFPGVYFTGAPAGRDGDEIVWNLDADERGVIKSGASEIFQAVVINSTPTYLVGA